MSKYTRLSLAMTAWLLAVLSGGMVRAAVSYLDNGTIKIGVDLNMGGAITYLRSKTGNTMNLVNSYDPGREIQQSYYYGNTNPVQAGDMNLNHSPVLAWSNTGSELYVKTRPLDWNMNNVPDDCYMEDWITLSGNVATVRNRLTSFRTGSWSFPELTAWQETPAVYTVGKLGHHWTYNGTRPFTGGALTEISTGHPVTGYTPWRATENWAACVDDSNFGVGVYHPGVGLFQGGFYGTRGVGGPTDANTGYIGVLRKECLDPNIVYDYEYKLIVGSVDNIRSYVYANKPDTRPNYQFNGSRQGWSYDAASGMSDGGFPIGDHLHTTFTTISDPQMRGPICGFRAADVPKLYIRAAFSPSCAGENAQLFWEVNNGDQSSYPFWSAEQSYVFGVIADGQYHTYELNLASVGTWSGLISALRFDPLGSGHNGDYMDIQFISHIIPEPGSLCLVATGIIGLLVYAWKKRT